MFSPIGSIQVIPSEVTNLIENPDLLIEQQDINRPMTYLDLVVLSLNTNHYTEAIYYLLGLPVHYSPTVIFLAIFLFAAAIGLTLFSTY